MLIPIGLALAFILLVLFGNRRTRRCRWRANRREDRENLSKYKCMACGAEAFTTTGKPPTTCHAAPSPPTE